MNPLHTVVLLSRDPALEVMLAGALSARAMRLLVFKGALEKLGALQDEQPHLILLDWMGLADEAERWIRETRRLAFGLRVPLVALASNADATNAALSAGADDFLLLPRDLEHLGVRLTACLRLVERVTQSGLTGAVRAGSPIRLLKLCEDHRLTGRLSIATADGKRFVDFLGGEVVEARVEPPVEGQEALDVFLAAQDGTFAIEPAPLDPSMLADGPVPSTEPDAATSQAPEKEAEAVVPIPAGRLSKVESAAPHPSYQIQTEGENRPNFTVTTIINRGGQIIRKVRTSWQHPLKKRADERLARAQIDRQHERVVSGLNEMIKARSLPPQAAGISSLLLIWVMHFIIEQTWVHLGTSVAVAVLRRTRASLARRFEVLKYFQVEEDAKVQVDPSPGQQLPADSVAAVAAWSARYLAEAARIVPDVGRLRVRQATILMEHALDQVGFYAAFDQAAAELALNQPQDARVSTGA